MRTVLSLALMLAAPAAAQQVAPTAPAPYPRAVAAGYKAAVLCSGLFVAGRTQAQVEREELAGIYDDYDGLLPQLAATVDRTEQRVAVAWSDGLPPRWAQYRVGKGCVTYPIGTPLAPPRPDSVPSRRTVAGADPRAWPLGDRGIAPRPSPALARTVAGAFDGRSYGTGLTTGVVVLRDGKMVAERYAAGWGPFVANRTWSVGKSLAGAIVGAARQAGRVDVARPAPVPEWQALGDPRTAITTDQLLRMASGLHSDTAGNRTDAIYFGGGSVMQDATQWPLEARPGTRFRYANNDILLALRGTRAAFRDDAAYQAFVPGFFARLGMSHTVAEQDWRGDFVLSSQVWSTARDLARFGQFLLQDGVWAGERVLLAGWLADSIRPSGPQPARGPGYGRTLWLFGQAQGLPAGSYAAQGNRGQYVMVIPAQRLVIVRRGEDGGARRFDIAKFAAAVAAAR